MYLTVPFFSVLTSPYVRIERLAKVNRAMAHQVWICHLICPNYALTLCVAEKHENAPNPGKFAMRDQAKNLMA
jgi:hypothetical protein